MTSLIKPRNCRSCGHHGKDGPGLVCCEAPPTLLMFPVETPQGTKIHTQVAFPPVQPDWMCGRWKPRILEGA
jgi:hypothetical protein